MKVVFLRSHHERWWRMRIGAGRDQHNLQNVPKVGCNAMAQRENACFLRAGPITHLHNAHAGCSSSWATFAATQHTCWNKFPHRKPKEHFQHAGCFSSWATFAAMRHMCWTSMQGRRCALVCLKLDGVDALVQSECSPCIMSELLACSKHLSMSNT